MMLLILIGSCTYQSEKRRARRGATKWIMAKMDERDLTIKTFHAFARGSDEAEQMIYLSIVRKLDQELSLVSELQS